MSEPLTPERLAEIPDVVGSRFGRLEIIEVVERRKYHWYVRTRCDCGALKVVRLRHLLNGLIVSCRCYSAEKSIEREYKHGHCKTSDSSCSRTYRVYIGMISRCEIGDPKGHYKARGISICQRWRDSFLNFLEDMGECPKGMSIDRIDNDGNYEPSNCRWATPKQQANNRRCVKLYQIQGELLSIAQISEKYGIPASRLYSARSRGEQIEKLISEAKESL